MPGFMRDRCDRKGGGFSLVELLVVVAVIAILAALLLPALGRGKAEARRTQCLSQLQQWGAGLQLYVLDNEEEIPRRGQGVRPLTQLDRPEDWFNALAPELAVQGFGEYVRNAGTNAASPPALFICPEARPAPARYFLSYAMNMYPCSTPPGTPRSGPSPMRGWTAR
jgi:prepilin-type N-terminal cleavage/methylation domain-containing protein